MFKEAYWTQTHYLALSRPKGQNCSRKVSLSENETLDTEKSLLDLYAKRNMFEADHPGISKCNFVQFASNYFNYLL